MVLRKINAVFLIITFIIGAIMFTACGKKKTAAEKLTDSFNKALETEIELFMELNTEVEKAMQELQPEASAAIDEVKTEVSKAVKEVKPDVKNAVKSSVTEAVNTVKEAVPSAAQAAPAAAAGAAAGNRAEIDKYFADYEAFIAKAEQTTGNNSASTKINLMGENANFTQKGGALQMSNAAWTSADMTKLSSLMSKAGTAIK